MFDVEDSILSTRELTLLKYLNTEYTPEVARQVLLPLITQTSPVSLRALDWAVVNWSKQHNVVCSSRVPGEMTNINHTYKMALNHWKRKLFDPFRRRLRVSIVVDGEAYETTLGQANFALWTYKTGILAYVLGHIEAIESHMNHASQHQKSVRREALRMGVKRKRRELTPSVGTTCVAYRHPIRVRFS